MWKPITSDFKCCRHWYFLSQISEFGTDRWFIFQYSTGSAFHQIKFVVFWHKCCILLYWFTLPDQSHTLDFFGMLLIFTLWVPLADASLMWIATTHPGPLNQILLKDTQVDGSKQPQHNHSCSSCSRPYNITNHSASQKKTLVSFPLPVAPSGVRGKRDAMLGVTTEWTFTQSADCRLSSCQEQAYISRWRRQSEAGGAERSSF